MANRRPTPLKDEPAVPLDELQEQISKLIAVVNSLVERTAAEKHQTDDRLQNAISMSVVKAVQDLLEARQIKFEEADKGKMSVNEVLQEILGQYEDICGKAKGFYMIYKGADDRFRHIDENLQKVCGNEKLKRVYHSRHVRLYVKICLFCIWVIMPNSPVERMTRWQGIRRATGFQPPPRIATSHNSMP